MTITPRQHEILAFIAERLREGEPSPTFADICKRFGFTSKNAAACHLYALARKGALDLGAFHRARTAKPTPAGWQLLGYSECRHCGGRVGPGKGRRAA